MLGDVLHTAADEGRIHRAAACEHRELSSRPECQAAATREDGLRGGRRMLWRGLSPQLWSPYTLPGKQMERLLLRASVHTASLSVPRPGLRGEASMDVDTVAKAPPFLFPNAWLAQRQGWLLQSPPQVALVHLLGVRCRWCLRSDDTDHGAKWEWWHLSGLFADEGYLRAPYLPRPASAPSAGAATTHPPPPLPSSQLNRSGEGALWRRHWRAAEAAIDNTAAHCGKSGKARLLYVDRPLLLAAPNLVREAERADDGGSAARVLVRRWLQQPHAAPCARVATLPAEAATLCVQATTPCTQAATVCIPGAAARRDCCTEWTGGRAAHLQLLRSLAEQGAPGRMGGLGPHERPARGACSSSRRGR